MATRVELQRGMEEAARAGNIGEIQKLLTAFRALETTERAAGIEATKGERTAWGSLVKEALAGIYLDPAAVEYTSVR